MSNRYRGFFTSFDKKSYELRIMPVGADSDWIEIPLAGNSPFVVTYNTSSTPFDPVRTSVATINIVHDDYLEDALSNCAHDTKVELLDITNGTPEIVWVGYVVPNVFNAGYSDCYESFTIEAADCISSLQYIDYEPINGDGIVKVIDILAQICDACEELEGFYWTNSKKKGASIIYPDSLAISEHNFMTNDTEEYWKLNDILFEICQYLGYTCLQYGTRMYFIDYQYLNDHSDIYATWFGKTSGYSRGTARHLDGPYTVTADSYKAGDASISIEPVYNKIIVNANMYAADDFIPNPFDDKYLINRLGDDFYAAQEITPIQPYKPSYPHGGTWYTLGFEQAYKEEEDADNNYVYHVRLYDNKYWDSYYCDTYDHWHYHVNPSPSELKSPDILKRYRGGTIVDLGVVKKEYRSETQQLIVPSKMDYKRYICICQKHTNEEYYESGHQVQVMELKSDFRPKVMLDDKAFLVLNCKATFERYTNRNYINPGWTNTESTTRWSAAGYYRNSIARPYFRIHIGNKGWSSYLNRWVNLDEWQEARYDYCTPEMKWDEKNSSFWNKEIEILNNVSWEDKVNCEGIKIPLDGIDTNQDITFQIINPNPSFFGNTGNPDFINKFYEYNAYCWISDLSLKCVEEGQEVDGNDSDVIYENVIDDCSISELNEIRVRITTHTYSTKPSYSHMIYQTVEKSTFLEGIKEESLGNSTAQKAEENIIQKYVQQYSTPTKKITLALENSIKPFQKLFGVDVENTETGYVPLGSEIDYKAGYQTITTIQKNK